MRWERVTLESHGARLEPLDEEHGEGLMRAASESRATYTFATVPESETKMREYVRAAFADWERGDGLAFATIDAVRDVVVGSTRFARAEQWPWPVEPIDGRTKNGIDAIEIGWTWLAASAQRTAINTQAKMLMLTHAFEVVGVRRVTLKTDARNERSRRAIERIGGKLDGVLCANMAGADGTIRDSAYFSILTSEWPSVKARWSSLASPTSRRV